MAGSATIPANNTIARIIHTSTEPNQTCRMAMLKKRYISPNTIVRTSIDSNNPVSGTAFISTALNTSKTASSAIARQTSGRRRRLYLAPPPSSWTTPTIAAARYAVTTRANIIFSGIGNWNIFILFVYAYMRLWVYALMRICVRSFTHSLIYSFTHLLIHSFTHRRCMSAELS